MSSFTPPKHILLASAKRQEKIKRRKAEGTSPSSPSSSTLSQIIGIEEARRERRQRNSNIKSKIDGLAPAVSNFMFLISYILGTKSSLVFKSSSSSARQPTVFKSRSGEQSANGQYHCVRSQETAESQGGKILLPPRPI